MTLCVQGWRAQAGQRGLAVFLLCVILAASVGHIGLWLLGGGVSAGLPRWMLLSVGVVLAAMTAECAVLARLILALRRPAGDRWWELAARRALVWLSVHAAALCASLALNVLFVWLL